MRTKILKNEILNRIKNQTLDAEYIENFESRWSEAESVIIKNPKWAYQYAKNVLKRRWPAAEPIIMKDPYAAYYYAMKFFPEGWPEAEPFIKENTDIIIVY